MEKVGTVISLCGNGAALLQLRDNKEGLRNAGMWVPPGGHAESAKTIDMCAWREFLEEADYNCSNLEWPADFEDAVAGWPPYQLPIFGDSHDGIQKICCKEGQDFKFLPCEDARSYNIPARLMNIGNMAISAAKIKRVIQ